MPRAPISGTLIALLTIMMIEDWPDSLDGIPQGDLDDVNTTPVRAPHVVWSRTRALAGALGALGSVLFGAVYQFTRRED